MPTSLVFQLFPHLAPIITEIVNKLLSSGIFLSSLKSVIVHPLRKKATLNSEIFKNYRPVSNLPFISKVIEKVIAARLLDHMQENNLLDPMQSAYKKSHSTETALLRIHNDIISSIDRGKGVFLILLDLSAAFDTVDHHILLSFLENHIGLHGTVLNLFRSYLTGRTQCVSINGVLSELKELAFGVPQGSVLGPIEFCTYTLPLGAIIRSHKLDYHIYADDTQLYFSFDLKNPSQSLDTICACASDIRSWMIKNKLKINDDKTEFLVITSPHAKIDQDIHFSIGQSSISPSESCKSLGVMFDSHINMERQIQNICRSAYFQLRSIGSVRHLLPDAAAAQLVHALITSRLDYCNSLLYGIPDSKMKRLQRLQNIAAHIVARCPKSAHITPVLHDLHWLPVKMRILFKILLLTYRCVHGTAPVYLSELIVPYRQNRSLRSSSKFLLSVP